MDVWENLIEPYKNYAPFFIFLEITAAFFGILSVVFSSRRSIYVYPLGIMSTIIYTYIYLKMNIPGNMLINVYYTGMSLFGWWEWSKAKNTNAEMPVEKCSPKDFTKLIFLGFAAVLFILLVYNYQKYVYEYFNLPLAVNEFTVNASSILDIVSTTLFFVAMWLMAKRKLENWLLWIVGDIICMVLMFKSQLYISAMLYMFLSGMAVIGFFSWKKSLK